MSSLGAGADGDDRGRASFEPDPIAIRAHLERLFRRAQVEYRDGLCEIAWTNNQGQPNRAKNFAVTPVGLDQATKEAVRRNLERRNVYVGVNPRKPGAFPSARAGASDVEIAFFQFADCDGPPSVSRLRGAPLPCTFAVITGSVPAVRVHPYWELEEPTRNMPAWSAQQVALKDYLGSDAVIDPPRIMRLAGTINYPPERKVARGYVVEQVTIRTLYDDEDSVRAEREPVSSMAMAAAYRLSDGSRQRSPGRPRHDPDEGEGLRREPSFGEVRISLERLLSEIRAGREWHNNTLRLVASMVARDCPNAIILAIAEVITLPGYTTEQTRSDLVTMIAGARRKGWGSGGQENGPGAALITEFNDRYAVVNEGGRAIVYERVHDVMLSRNKYLRITFDDLRRLHFNRRVRVGEDAHGRPITKAAADVWLAHPDRRQFIRGIIFDPSEQNVSPDILNLWQGFAVQSKPGSWARLRDHILHVICIGNRRHFDFLIGWMARLMQRPAEQGEVAVVMRGGEGTGKGTLAKALLRILGQHGLAISNGKHLTGAFNGHLRDTVLLFADEAFWAGDKANVGVLRSLITEPLLTIEAKYQTPVQTPNFVHLMMASNEDWVVPASLDARRFFVLEVSNDRANDHSYFSEIWAELEAGGYEAMLHDLQHYDLRFYNPRRVPVTEGLQTQRKLSLHTAEDWWLQALFRGYVFKSRLGLEGYFCEWHEQMATEILFDAYATHAKTRRERHPMGREAFGKFMVRMGAKSCRPRNAVIGEHIIDAPNQYGGTTRRADLIKVDRAHGFSLGSLSEARADFQKACGLPIEWPADDRDAS